MKAFSLVQVVVISVSLFIDGISFHEWLIPAHAQAEAGRYNFYIEPGNVTIQPPDKSGQFYGKLMVDMDTGNIRGFPTMTASPYPVDSIHSAAPVSHPIYLGRYDFAGARK